MSKEDLGIQQNGVPAHGLGGAEAPNNCLQVVRNSEVNYQQRTGLEGGSEIISRGPDSENESETSTLSREVRRLKVLKSYLGVLDCDYGNKFERLTALAARVFRVPMSLVTIADLDKQYCISSRGLDYTSTIKSPFCSHAVLTNSDLLLVTDAAKDHRFANDPQVTGYPHVRFYAGAPLVCPEGYRLGTLCVMDTKPRSTALELGEKQSLMELADMAMETLIDLRKKQQYALTEPSQQIACTAHDLLTPLTGIALTLSLLKEDEALQRKLTDQQRDMIDTAANSSAVMNNICHKTMDFFRDHGKQPRTSQPKSALPKKVGAPSPVKVSDLVKNLSIVMEPFPKQVPIIFTVDPAVPPEFVSDDMKIFRSATNFLTNACAKTETGSIHLRIFTRINVELQKEVVFECEDTGPGVDITKYPYLFKLAREESDPLRVSGSCTVLKDVPPGGCRAGVQNSGLGLYSVATQISSIGGKYGFRPRSHTADGRPSRNAKETGSIFWFAIPLIIAQNQPNIPLPTAGEPRLKKGKRIGGDAARRASILGKDLSLRGIQPPAMSKKGLKRTLNSDDALEAYTSKTKTMFHNQQMNASYSSDRKKHALVIEDSLVVRKSLARVLSKLDFEVTQAVNGMEGLKELKESLFDLVLCDFLMPVMDGLDCIQQYRQWEKVNRPFFRQYIVGISAHANEKDIEQGFRVGMNDFRPKPVSYKELTDLKNGKEFSRTSFELDKLGQEIEVLKRRKITEDISSDFKSNSIAQRNQKVCLVVERTSMISTLAKLASEMIGWRIVSSSDQESALGLLKMRNWDAIVVDDELGCSRCISIFREWEKNHRVNRQKNVIFMSANYVSKSQSSSFQVPTGFDGALGKPIQLSAIQAFLERAKSNCDIVAR